MKRAGRGRPLILSIGSTDPTGAAGITRDLLVYERLGAAGAFAVAAVTAQNERRVTEVYPLAARALRNQLDAITQERRVSAVRIGLLPDAPLIAATARFLRAQRRKLPVVLDPVISSSSKHRFLGAAEIGALEGLARLATVITPNAAEAAELSGHPVRTTAQAREAAQRLRKRGCAVLVTGGHLRDKDAVDVLSDKSGVVEFRSPRIAAAMRGTGCTLSAAIAVYLGRGLALRPAIRNARKFVRTQLEAQRRTRGKARA
ncbi:MAG: hydroxymethylpyrimidine/phosphomethylpyrimidine kinase [Candidatus Eremiobacteraeota bacterium]|nr:hydroxymethylpyrimidine/phosphomethylpyrimidine kinase [Candidatus Eremiobacteraeota bacterium]MBV8366185.1 hydroxymethylpyrimidine/phosphomethylpyrimidine kinase [Candidatus Eremiobacteraeota bacterium]